MENTETGAREVTRIASSRQHFDLPRIRRVAPGRPFAWLAARLSRHARQPGRKPCLRHDRRGDRVGDLELHAGPAAALHRIGHRLLPDRAAAGGGAVRDQPPPRAAACDTSFGESLQGWRRSGGALAHFGLELVLVAIFWERLSAILFALSYNGDAPDLRSVLLATSFCPAIIRQVVLVYVASAQCSRPSSS